MPSGHTDRATINERRPLTRSMRAMVDRIKANEKTPLVWGELTTPDKNTIRALKDRGIVDREEGPIRLTPNRKDRTDG